MNTPNPTAQMILVGEARAKCNIRQPKFAIANKLDSTLQSKMDNVAVRGYANGALEHAREVEWAASRYFCECGHFNRLVQVSQDIILEPLEHVLAQPAARPAVEARRVTGK